MPGNKKGLFAVGIFTLGLLIGLALGSFTGALPKENLQTSPNVAEGAGNNSPELSGGLSSVGTEEVVYQGYLGVYNDHIAIYDGIPPTGVLRHVMTDFEVRDDVRPQLEAGIPFTDTYHLLRLLENYTS